MRKYFSCSAVLVSLLLNQAFAQTGDAGNTGLSFLKIGIGGRGAALAEAHVADATGAEATFWNPANLASSSGGELYLSHSEWLQDITNDFVAVKFGGGKSFWGVSLLLQNVPGIMQRTRPSAEPISELTSHHIAFGLSYARQFSSKLNGGVTVKYLAEKILNYASNGFGVDLGVRYKTSPESPFALAASIHNLGSVEEFRTEDVKLPTYLRAGLVFAPDFKLGNSSPNLFASVRSVLDAKTIFNFGAEILPHDVVAVRLGYQGGNETQSLAGGLGLKSGNYRFDYSYSPADFDFGNSHRFSLAIKL